MLEYIISEVTFLNQNDLFLVPRKSYKFFLLNSSHCTLTTTIYSITGGRNPTAYIMVVSSNGIFNISYNIYNNIAIYIYYSYNIYLIYVAL